MNNSTLLKVCLVGSGGVGKSCLAIQYVKHVFVENYDPTVVDSYRCTRTFQKRKFQVVVFDTAGQQEFARLCGKYVQDSDVFLIVYSVDNQYSFKKVHTLRNHIYRLKEAKHKSPVFVPIVLVANKTDIDVSKWQVSTKDGQSAAADMDIPFIETSARDSINVDAAFQETYELYFQNQLDQGNSIERYFIPPNPETTESKTSTTVSGESNTNTSSQNLPNPSKTNSSDHQIDDRQTGSHQSTIPPLNSTLPSIKNEFGDLSNRTLSHSPPPPTTSTGFSSTLSHTKKSSHSSINSVGSSSAPNKSPKRHQNDSSSSSSQSGNLNPSDDDLHQNRCKLF